MSGRWQTSNRRSRLPANWQRLRSQVLRRDNHRCQWEDHLGIRCNLTATDVDHIIAGDDHRIDNLQSLCAAHHAFKSSSEGGHGKHVAREKVKASFLRRPESRFE